MNNQVFNFRRGLLLFLAAFALAAMPGFASEGVFPFLDCVEHDRAANQTLAHFGYDNQNSQTINVPFGSTNFFTPPPAVRLQPTEFSPGINRRVFSTTINWNEQTEPLRWVILDNSSAAALRETFLPCAAGFVYQGRLAEGGAAQTGVYDFQFRLFSLQTNGSALETQTLDDVQVTGGIFTVELNFALERFTQTDGLFLEIAVRRGSETGGYATLSPRQKIAPQPFSLHAAQASLALNAERLGGYTLAQILNGSPGAPGFIRNQTDLQASASFNIGGNGTIGGTLSAQTINSVGQFNLGGARILSAPGSGRSLFAGLLAGENNTGSDNSFFGYAAGRQNSSGSSNAFFGLDAGLGNTTGGGNSFFGRGAGFQTTTGFENVFIGRDAASGNTTGSTNTIIGAYANTGASNLTNATAVGANAVVSQSNSVVLGNNAYVGIGTSAPKAKLHVAGKIYVEANGQGIIFKSPNGSCFELTVSNAGALTTASAACP